MSDLTPAEWLKEALGVRGLTQSGLAECMGFDKTIANRIVNGRRKIRLDEAPAVAEYLGVKMDELMLRLGLSNHAKAVHPYPRVTIANGNTVTLSFNHTVTIDQAQRILAILKEGT